MQVEGIAQASKQANTQASMVVKEGCRSLTGLVGLEGGVAEQENRLSVVISSQCKKTGGREGLDGV